MVFDMPHRYHYSAESIHASTGDVETETLYANTLIGLRNIITHKGMVPSDVIDSPHLIF